MMMMIMVTWAQWRVELNQSFWRLAQLVCSGKWGFSVLIWPISISREENNYTIPMKTQWHFVKWGDFWWMHWAIRQCWQFYFYFIFIFILCIFICIPNFTGKVQWCIVKQGVNPNASQGIFCKNFFGKPWQAVARKGRLLGINKSGSTKDIKDIADIADIADISV